MSHLVTIVIPTFNGGELFNLMIRQLKSQSIINQCEIIIIDSGSSDSTLEYAKQIDVTIYEIKQCEFNHGLTRNLGASYGNSEFICFMTQDAIPKNPFMLEKMVQSIRKNDAAGCYARQIPRSSASPLVCRDVCNWISGKDIQCINQFTKLNGFLELTSMGKYFTCVFDNVTSMIKREVWEKIPFPSTPFGEDIEWSFRAMCNGYKIVYEPEAVVEHSHERSSTYLYKRTFVDHYRLYELFGIRTVTGKWAVIKSCIQTTMTDWLFLCSQFQFQLKWIHWMMGVPFDAWASAWGQYMGAKAAAKGLPIFQSKDV